MKKKKKTFILTAILKLNSKKPIVSQEIEFTDERGRGFDGPMFAMAMLNHEERLAKELLTFKWEVKK